MMPPRLVIFRLVTFCLLLPGVAGAEEKAAALAQQGEGELAALLAAVAKVSGALAVVVGLMFLVLYFVKKFDLGRGRFNRGSLIEVLDTRMIAPRKYISVVNIGGELLAIGVSEQHISMLARLDPAVTAVREKGRAAESAQATPSTGPFATMLARAGLRQSSGAGTEQKDGENHA